MNRKIVYLHKRLDGADVATFHDAMSGAPLGEAPGLVAYVQSQTLQRGYAKGELLYDAVEELTFENRAAADRFRGSDGEAQFLAGRPLSDPDKLHVMIVEVHRVKDVGVPADAVKNIEFVNRRPGMDLDAFRRYWREIHGPIGSEIPSILRYEQNHLARETYDGGEPRYDGLAITWFESTSAMRSGAETEAYRVTRADEANFLPDGHLPIIITKEVRIDPKP